MGGNHLLERGAGLLTSSGTMTDTDTDSEEEEDLAMDGEGQGVEHIILEPPAKSTTPTNPLTQVWAHCVLILAI